MLDSKEDKFRRVAKSAMAILADEGESKLTFSRLAKHANVSRPWIYKQFGTKVDDLLFFSAKVIGSHFALAASAHPMSTPEECLAVHSQAFEQSLLDLEEWPWIPKIYFAYVGRSGPIGDAIREVERIYIDRVATVFSDVFRLRREQTELIALSFIKIWAVAAHSWIQDARIRESGPKATVEMMMLPFSFIRKT